MLVCVCVFCNSNKNLNHNKNKINLLVFLGFDLQRKQAANASECSYGEIHTEVSRRWGRRGVCIVDGGGREGIDGFDETMKVKRVGLCVEATHMLIGTGGVQNANEISKHLSVQGAEGVWAVAPTHEHNALVGRQFSVVH